MQDLEIKVKSIIGHQLSQSMESIENEKSFIEDLGVDSLDMVSLLVALEEALEVEISDDEALQIKTVQDAINFSKKIVMSRGDLVDTKSYPEI